MQATFGSSYINDFNLYGRTFRVYTQSEKDYRARPEDHLSAVGGYGAIVVIAGFLQLYKAGRSRGAEARPARWQAHERGERGRAA